jgi:phenylpropionate dioxygenase-like ring-hydroxylating dioxygenase large terminal subunit
MKRIDLPPVPNGWYKTLYSDELGIGEAKPLSILGRDYAIYRGADGRVRITDAYCPHLGAHLGHGGKVEGDALACPFHGWRWDGETGRCVGIPYAKRIPAKAEIATHPTRERNGYVMLWHHAEGAAPDFEVPEIPETSDPAFRLYKRMRWELDSHVQEIYENIVDVAHFQILHKMDVQKIHWGPVGGDDSATIRLHVDLLRENVEQAGEGGKTEIESFLYGPGLQVTRLSGRMRGVSVNSLTPLGDERVEVGHAYYVQRSDPASEREVEAYWDYYMQDHYLDFQIWNHKRFLERPLLANGDGDVAAFRRWFRRFYEGVDGMRTSSEGQGAGR